MASKSRQKKSRSDLDTAKAVFKALQPKGRRLLARNVFAGIHPILVEKLKKIHAEMEARGLPMVATDGARTADQQNYLYQQGRTRPGKIVTWVDGYKKRSNHQLKDDGYGYAVDSTFINKATGRPWWPDFGRWPRRWEVFGELCEIHGLSWGGRWRKPDRPHVELLL